MSIARKIHITMTVEECSRPEGYESDPELRYVISTTDYRVEGELYFKCKRSALERTLESIFKVQDPFMKTTSGLVPNSHTSLGRFQPYDNRYSSDYRSSSSLPATRSGHVPFLTREPIYRDPPGHTTELVREIGEAVLGREAGDGITLLGELLESIVNPEGKKRRT